MSSTFTVTTPSVLPVALLSSFLMLGSKIEQKRCALTWHYRNADPEYGQYQARELQTHLEQAIIPKHSIEILTGKANLEVRPRDINKGEIVARLIKDNSENLEFVFCAGDDKTDEGFSVWQRC